MVSNASWNRGDATGALKLALPSSPLVIDCLLAVRPTDIPNVVKGLQAEEWDAVIKALFAGWKAGKVDNGLLVWFEKVGASVNEIGFGFEVNIMSGGCPTGHGSCGDGLYCSDSDGPGVSRRAQNFRTLDPFCDHFNYTKLHGRLWNCSD
jgi:hypothetical protein